FIHMGTRKGPRAIWVRPSVDIGDPHVYGSMGWAFVLIYSTAESRGCIKGAAALAISSRRLDVRFLVSNHRQHPFKRRDPSLGGSVANLLCFPVRGPWYATSARALSANVRH